MRRARITKKPISELIPADYNPREIDEEEAAGLRNSLEHFGNVQPIVWNKRSGNVVGGHQRLKILKEFGAKTVDITEVNLSPEEEKALNITLNNPGITGRFTDDLELQIKELQKEIPDLTKDLNIDGLVSDIEPPELKNATLRPYKKSHILISFDPNTYPEIQEQIESIQGIEGIEIEQSSN